MIVDLLLTSIGTLSLLQSLPADAGHCFCIHNIMLHCCYHENGVLHHDINIPFSTSSSCLLIFIFTLNEVHVLLWAQLKLTFSQNVSVSKMCSDKIMVVSNLLTPLGLPHCILPHNYLRKVNCLWAGNENLPLPSSLSVINNCLVVFYKPTYRVKRSRHSKMGQGLTRVLYIKSGLIQLVAIFQLRLLDI